MSAVTLETPVVVALSNAGPKGEAYNWLTDIGLFLNSYAGRMLSLTDLEHMVHGLEGVSHTYHRPDLGLTVMLAAKRGGGHVPGAPSDPRFLALVEALQIAVAAMDREDSRHYRRDGEIAAAIVLGRAALAKAGGGS